jgi:anti-sigma regulatory factor (Ser/Thr protein kinase)
LSSRSAAIDLPPIPPSITVSRHLVLELLRTWGVPHDREDAAMLVTELVSNVVDHVRREANLTLELAVSDECLRIAVVDGSSVQPVVHEFVDGPAAGARDADGPGHRGPLGCGGPPRRQAGLVRAALPGPVSRLL